MHGGRDGKGIHLVVVGAGLAGLATALSAKLANVAHEVTVLEAARRVHEVGAGLHLSPNATRLLARWGLLEKLSNDAVEPAELCIYKHDGSKVLSQESDLRKQMAERYGFPFWTLHRITLQQAMVKHCQEMGIDVRFNSRVTAVDFDEAVVTTGQDGTTINGDVVLLADGLYSLIRSRFVGHPSPALATGYVTYRLALDVDRICGPDRDELVAAISQPTMRIWVAPGSLVLGHSVSAGKAYNLKAMFRDAADVDEDDNDCFSGLSARLAGWDPLLHKFLANVGKSGTARRWKPMCVDPVPRWTNDSGTFFMAGDCCNSTYPDFFAQNASASLEDGAALGHLLGHVHGPDARTQLPRVARLYGQLRTERRAAVQREADELGQLLELRASMDGQAQGTGVSGMHAFASRRTSRLVQRDLYSYDAYDQAERAYRECPS